jgi:lysylphosphatidylglycerol synthetase-like protein (DUF2156 family)
MFGIETKQRKRNKFFKYLGWYAVEVSRTAFTVSVISYIVYLALENFKTGIISNYFDLNILLITAALTGLIIILFNEEKKTKRPRRRIFTALVLALIVAVYSYQEFNNLGKISYLLTFLITLTIFSIIVILDRQNYD